MVWIELDEALDGRDDVHRAEAAAASQDVGDLKPEVPRGHEFERTGVASEDRLRSAALRLAEHDRERR